MILKSFLSLNDSCVRILNNKSTCLDLPKYMNITIQFFTIEHKAYEAFFLAHLY